MNTPAVAFVGALVLVGIGLVGALTCRNLIKVAVALQIMMKGVLIALVAAGAAQGQINLGQSLAAIVLGVDTIGAVILLALSVQVRRRFGTLDVSALSQLRR